MGTAALLAALATPPEFRLLPLLAWLNLFDIHLLFIDLLPRVLGPRDARRLPCRCACCDAGAAPCVLIVGRLLPLRRLIC
jgi:hypothetical protein